MNLIVLLALLQAEPQGTPDQKLQYKLARAWHHSETPDPAVLAAAKSSSAFGPRYVTVLLQIRDSLTRGECHERAYQRIVELSVDGGPPGAADHVRALSAGFKAAVYCRECMNGKVVCAQCSGRKRTEVKCYACEGKGRVGAPGAVDKSQVTQKCRNCDGKAVFRDARCPGCSGSGLNDCSACLGSPWHDRACAVKECRIGRVPCPRCRAKGKVEATCPSCQGKGRVGAPGAIDPTQVTQRCNDCDGKGVLKERQPCPGCNGSSVGMGYLKCTACRTEGHKNSAAPLSAVFDTDPCAACGGKGRPVGGKAVACTTCLGLGVRIKPATDPTKLLE